MSQSLSIFSNIENKIEDYSIKNTKNYWKAIKGLMKNYKTSDSIPVLKRCIDGVELFCFTDEEKADCLNEYFISISKLDDSNIVLPTLEYV